MNALPATYNENPDAYNDFLNRFGTHYFSLARFGSTIILHTEIKKYYVQHELSIDIKAKIEESFFGLYKTDMDMEAKIKSVDSNFNEQSFSSFHYYGGHGALSENSKTSEWLKSAILDPWLFSGKLESIDKVIARQKEFADKAKEVSLAIQIKLAKATLADLENIMTLSDSVKQNVEGSDESKKLLENSRNYFNNDKKEINSNELDEKSEELRHLLKNAHAKVDCSLLTKFFNQTWQYCLDKYPLNYHSDDLVCESCQVFKDQWMCKIDTICENEYCNSQSVITTEEVLRRNLIDIIKDFKCSEKCNKDIDFWINPFQNTICKPLFSY